MKHFLFSIFLILLVSIAYYGWTKQEKVECYKLKKQAQEYQNFTATNWQKKMCLSHDIEL